MGSQRVGHNWACACTHTHTHSHIASPDASGAFETVCQPCISQLWVSQPSQTEQIPIRSFPLKCLLPQKGTTIPSYMSFLGGSDRKESVCNAGDPSSILVLGRSPGEGNGKPLQSSCLENPMEEDPGSLKPMGSQRVRHGWVTNILPSIAFSSHCLSTTELWDPAS